MTRELVVNHASCSGCGSQGRRCSCATRNADLPSEASKAAGIASAKLRDLQPVAWSISALKADEEGDSKSAANLHDASASYHMERAANLDEDGKSRLAQAHRDAADLHAIASHLHATSNPDAAAALVQPRGSTASDDGRQLSWVPRVADAYGKDADDHQLPGLGRNTSAEGRYCDEDEDPDEDDCIRRNAQGRDHASGQFTGGFGPGDDSGRGDSEDEEDETERTGIRSKKGKVKNMRDELPQPDVYDLFPGVTINQLNVPVQRPIPMYLGGGGVAPTLNVADAYADRDLLPAPATVELLANARRRELGARVVREPRGEDLPLPGTVSAIANEMKSEYYQGADDPAASYEPQRVPRQKAKKRRGDDEQPGTTAKGGPPSTDALYGEGDDALREAENARRLGLATNSQDEALSCPIIDWRTGAIRS